MKREAATAGTTVAGLLANASGQLASANVPDPRSEAAWLLADCLGVSRAWIIAHPEAGLSAAVVETVVRQVERRVAKEPFAYVVGHREFFGLDLEVGPAVLIPRPETELLVEAALAGTHRLFAAKGAPLLVADVGTGSGAIAIALAARIPSLRVIALDTSTDALGIARRNAERHGVAQRIEFRQSNLLEAVEEKLDILVANLPYIPTAAIDDLMPDVREYEPRSALDGGPDGTLLIRRTLEDAHRCLAEKALLLFEIGEGQGECLARLARQLYTRSRVRVQRDYAGFERILTVELG